MRGDFVTSILASDMPQIIENERKEKEEKRLTKEKGNKNEKKKRAQKSKEKKQELEDDSDIFSLRDSNDRINLLDQVQDVEFDNEEDFCATPQPSRIKGLQIMVVFRNNLQQVQAIKRSFCSMWTSL